MGCGASRSANGAGPAILDGQRDPEDHSLEAMQLQTTNIEGFDQVFSRLQDLLNSLVELNNGVNDAVAEVKVAFAAAANSFELHTTIGPSTDILLVDLYTSKSSNIRPHPDDVQILLDDPDVRIADFELEVSRTALHAFLTATTPSITIEVSREGLLHIPLSDTLPSQLQNLNLCLTRLRELLGSRAYLSACIKPAIAYGKPTVKAVLKRYVGGPQPEPVPLLEVCASQYARSIKDSEAVLVDRAQYLAHRARTLELEWQVEAGYRISITSDITSMETRDQIADILQSINVSMFKLMNSGASAFEPASLANAVVQVVRPVLEQLKEKHALDYPPSDLKSLISVQPTVEFRRDDSGSPPVFDFNINVDMSQGAGIPPFPECLTERTGQLLAALYNLKEVIAESLEALPPISEEVDISLEHAKEFYELCPDAAAKKGLTMMEAVKCSKATGSNLRTLYTTQELFLAFGENVKRVADELAASVVDVNELVENML